MSCKEVCDFLDAYMDKELDVISTSQFDRHLTECAACRAKYEQYRQMHGAVKAQMEYFERQKRLSRKFAYSSATPREKEETRREWFPRWHWPVLASVAIVLLQTALLVQMLRRPRHQRC